MPNDWINEDPKDAGWLDKKPADSPELKTLDDIGTDRQKASEMPKPEPVPPAPLPPPEDIPYDKVSAAMGAAANDILAASERLSSASVNLMKISVLAGSGPKGKALVESAKRLKERIDQMSGDMRALGEDAISTKNSVSNEPDIIKGV